jgi:hypothetical protein
VDSLAAVGDGEAGTEVRGADSGEAEAAGAAEGAGVAEGAGLAAAVVPVEACGDPAVVAGFGVAAVAALRTSFSRTPARRFTLWCAVSTVSSNVTAKKVQPR